MTPLRTIAQQVNDAPYTTPAKRGPKIGSRAYCGHLIFGGPLLRTSLNDRPQIADEQFMSNECASPFLISTSSPAKGDGQTNPKTS